jgi:hypothetical protein
MRKFIFRLAGLAVFFVLVMPLAAYAQEKVATETVVMASAQEKETAVKPATAVNDTKSEDRWRPYIGILLWAANADTKMQAGSVTAEGDASFGDILENLKGVFMGEAGIAKGKFSISGELIYMGLQKDIPISGSESGDRTTSLDLLVVQALAGYDLFEIPVGKQMKLTITPSVGPRYFYTRFMIDNVGGGELRDKTLSWVDFTTGLGLTLDINEKFSLLAKGTAGGFGWGSSSELAWSAGGFVDYHIRDWSTLRLGYSVIDVEKKSSSSFGDVQLNLTFSGPVVEWIIGF